MPGHQIGPHRPVHRGHRDVGQALAHGAVVAAHRHRHAIAKVVHTAKRLVKNPLTRKTTTRQVTAHQHDSPDTGAEFIKMSISFGEPVGTKLPKLVQDSIKTQISKMTLGEPV